MFEFILSQLLASVTLATECYAMQLKNQQRLLVLLSVSCFFNSMHFFLLGQQTAGFILLFASLRFLIALRWKSQWLAVAALAVSAVITIFTYSGLLSILGLLGVAFITCGSFSANDKLMRIMIMLGSLIWLGHNALLGSPLGVIVEGMFIASGLLGFYRYYIAPKQKTTATPTPA